MANIAKTTAGKTATTGQTATVGQTTPKAEPGKKRLAHIVLETVRYANLWYITASSEGHSVHAIDNDCENATQRALDDLALLLRSGDIEENPGPEVDEAQLVEWFTIVRGKALPTGHSSPLYESFVKAICLGNCDVEPASVDEEEPSSDAEGSSASSEVRVPRRPKRPKPKRQPNDDDVPSDVEPTTPRRPTTPVPHRQSRRERRDAYLTRMTDFSFRGVLTYLRLFRNPGDASALRTFASVRIGETMTQFLQSIETGDELGTAMDAMFPHEDNSWLGVMAGLLASDLCALAPRIKKQDWSGIAAAISNHKQHALNGNTAPFDVVSQGSVSLALGDVTQHDTVIYTNTSGVTQVWTGLSLDAEFVRAAGEVNGSSTFFGCQIAPTVAPAVIPISASAFPPTSNWILNGLVFQQAPGIRTWTGTVNYQITIPPGSSLFFSSIKSSSVAKTTDVIFYIRMASHSLYGSHNQEMHATNGNINSRDENEVVGVNPLGWFLDFAVLAQEAAGHNARMHALNGNTDSLATASAVASVGVPPPVEAPKEAGRVSKVPTVGGIPATMARITKLFGSDGFIQPPTQAVASVPIGLAQYAKTIKPVYFNQGGLSGIAYGGYHESYFSEVGAIDETDALSTQRRFSTVYTNDRHTSLAQLHRSQADFMTNTGTGNITGASQYIRINSATFSGDSRSRIMLADAASILAGNIGSNAAPLARLLLYNVSEVPLLGPEFSQAIGNTQSRLDYGGGAGPQRNLDALWWPLSSAHAAAAPAINARMISLSEFSQMRSSAAGQRAITVPAGWEMGEWGYSVAVIPVTMALMNAPTTMCAWTLAFMEYPYRSMAWTVEVSDDSGNTTIPYTAHPMANSCRLQGPTTKVLFVCTDTLSADASLSIGTIVPVSLSYAANGFSPAAASLDIGPSISAEFAVADNWHQAVTEAQQWWRAVLGSVEDERAAYVIAADHSFVTAPNPQRTRGTMALAYASQTSVPADTPAWVAAAGYTPIAAATVVATLASVASSSTHPVDPFIDTDIAVVRAGVQRAAAIGQYDGVMAVYMAARIMEPQHPARAMCTNNLVQVVWFLRELAAGLGCLVDEAAHQVGLGMEEMLAPAAIGGNGMQAVVLKAWQVVFGLINDHVLKCAGAPARYYFTATSALAKPFYTVAITQTMPWQRAPAWMCPGVDGRLPQRYASPGTTWTVTLNYPAPGDIAEVWPVRGALSELDCSTWLSGAAVVNPTNPAFGIFDLQLAMSAKNGTVVQDLFWPATHPSIGQWAQRVLTDARPIPISTTSWVDWPMYPVLPTYSARYLQERYPLAFGTLVNYIRSAGVRILNLRLMDGVESYRDVEMASTEGLDPFMSRLGAFLE